MTNGYVIGDGSWTLTIKVTDFHVERRLRVKGDLHVGGVMLKLVEDLGELSRVFGVYKYEVAFRYALLFTIFRARPGNSERS